ncbi:HAD-IIIA family hydrolase [Candidatus Woesearchaeota archaeon]|nr:HAD-IIIA family hydrolase [Candidatus Woesearchaeota archaeon]
MIKARLDSYKSDKIVGMAEAARIIAKLKSAGKAVGLCHGAFDLMHPGHIKHLESASKLCDCLFVSVTSDRFVSLRKGAGRPVFPDALRAYSVASLKYADYAVISDFEKATEVIKKLKPSYYIKGPDFAGKSTPGITEEREVIKSVGGKILYTSDEKLSTTEIVNHIIKNSVRKKILLAIDRDGTLIEHVSYLGKEESWKEKVKLNQDVANLLSYIKAKNDAVMVVVSNQQGIARGYFSSAMVDTINRHISALLNKKGIEIDNWQYCPHVDIRYANAMKNTKFVPEFIKDTTERKPNPGMVYRALKELNMKKDGFDKIIIIGNSKDDLELAKNINAGFIDAAGKDYRELKEEFDRL